jgi:sensor histidine kinase YesM
MTKDKILRFLFIPLLGIIIPYLSDIVSYSLYSPLELIAIYVYFIFLSGSIWMSCSWLHHKIRTWFALDQNIFVKIATLSSTNAIFGGAIAAIFGLVWYRISKETFKWTPFLLIIILSSLAVILLTLVYEILYLSRERELDSKIVDQLDWERSVAQMANLKNELEPHFIFNSLNTLSHLILNDPATAHDFNNKLACVYKYFLLNKDRDMISLRNEMEFIENYFFLIRIRYENQINLTTNLNDKNDGKIMILPFALQIAMENAIKHNEFSTQEPLNISIEMNDGFVIIKNNKKQKKYTEPSTGIGLKNLKSRYRLIRKKDIGIEDTAKEFIVTLPLFHQNL